MSSYKYCLILSTNICMVSMYDCGEPVSYDNSGLALADLHQRQLNILVSVIGCRGSLKEDDGRGLEDCPRYADTLLLSPASSLSNKLQQL